MESAFFFSWLTCCNYHDLGVSQSQDAHQTRQLMIESWHNGKHRKDQTTAHDVFKDVPWYDAHEPAGRSHFGEKLRNLNKNMRWIHSYWMSRLELGMA